MFKEWYRICELPGANDTASAHFILQLHQNGLLKGDDLTDRFFRLLLVWLFFHHIGYSFLLMTRIVSVTSFLVLFFQELAVAHCLSTEMINSGSLQSQQLQTMSFLAIDIYAKLVFSILKVVNCISFSFLVSFWNF